MENYPSKIRNKTRMPVITTAIQQVLEILIRVIKQEKEIKHLQAEQKEAKLSLFADEIDWNMGRMLKTSPKSIEMTNEYKKCQDIKPIYTICCIYI